MKRDQTDFTLWWDTADIISKIEYHTDLSFACLPNEVILIDEADEFIFKDPALF
jgi:hypothetical protein